MERLQSITWEAPTHYHIEKSSDWYWALGIITIAGTLAAGLLGNPLFAILIMVGGAVMGLSASRDPRVIPYAVTNRGIRIGDLVYPYSTLESYHIDDEHPFAPLLLVKSERLFMPLLVIPMPEEYIDEVESIIAPRLRTEHLEEPLATKLLEFFGF